MIPGTPAEKAGLKPGDIIQAINGTDITGENPPGRLMEIVGGSPPGAKLSLTVEREEQKIEKVVTLMNRKAILEDGLAEDQVRVDSEKAEQLLKDDYLRWLIEERLAQQALK